MTQLPRARIRTDLIKAYALVATCGMLLVVAVVLGMGGPVEALAVVRLDRMDAVPLDPFLNTCYAPGFSHTAFESVAAGDSRDSVRARLGPPLEITLADEPGDRVVHLQLRDGRYVVRAAYGMAVHHGSPWESGVGLAGDLRETEWAYTRQCGPQDSYRMRSIGFDGDLVEWRHAGVWYD